MALLWKLTLVLVEIGKTWRHSDVTHGRPIRTSVIFLPKCAELMREKVLKVWRRYAPLTLARRKEGPIYWPPHWPATLGPLARGGPAYGRPIHRGLSLVPVEKKDPVTSRLIGQKLANLSLSARGTKPLAVHQEWVHITKCTNISH